MLCFKIGKNLENLKITFVMCITWWKKCQSRIGGESTGGKIFLFVLEKIISKWRFWRAIEVNQHNRKLHSVHSHLHSLIFVPVLTNWVWFQFYLGNQKNGFLSARVRTLRRKCLRFERKEMLTNDCTVHCFLSSFQCQWR